MAVSLMSWQFRNGSAFYSTRQLHVGAKSKGNSAVEVLTTGPVVLNWKTGRIASPVFARLSCRRGVVVGGVVGVASWIAGGVVAAGAMAAVAMARDGGSRRAAVLATREGMQLFSQGDVKGSLKKFDEALELDPRQLPYLWQRGLSLYYVDRFEEGAKQFRDDVAVNPNDTEESIWCFLCEAQLYGVEEARLRFLKVGPDQRPIMRKIQELFVYGGSPDEIKSFHLIKIPPERGILIAAGSKDGADFFYASLYAGLYHEAHKNRDAAKDAILSAVRSPYGSRSGDYMAILSRVHAECRGWL